MKNSLFSNWIDQETMQVMSSTTTLIKFEHMLLLTKNKRKGYMHMLLIAAMLVIIHVASHKLYMHSRCIYMYIYTFNSATDCHFQTEETHIKWLAKSTVSDS